MYYEMYFGSLLGRVPRGSSIFPILQDEYHFIQVAYDRVVFS